VALVDGQLSVGKQADYSITHSILSRKHFTISPEGIEDSSSNGTMLAVRGG